VPLTKSKYRPTAKLKENFQSRLLPAPSAFDKEKREDEYHGRGGRKKDVSVRYEGIGSVAVQYRLGVFEHLFADHRADDSRNKHLREYLR